MAVVAQCRPKLVLWENTDAVKNKSTDDPGSDVESAKAAVEFVVVKMDFGYTPHVYVVSSRHYAVPRMRIGVSLPPCSHHFLC